MQPLQNCIGPTICIGQEILCLPYAGLLYSGFWYQLLSFKCFPLVFKSDFLFCGGKIFRIFVGFFKQVILIFHFL